MFIPIWLILGILAFFFAPWIFEFLAIASIFGLILAACVACIIGAFSGSQGCIMLVGFVALIPLMHLFEKYKHTKLF